PDCPPVTSMVSFHTQQRLRTGQSWQCQPTRGGKTPASTAPRISGWADLTPRPEPCSCSPKLRRPGAPRATHGERAPESDRDVESQQEGSQCQPWRLAG